MTAGLSESGEAIECGTATSAPGRGTVGVTSRVTTRTDYQMTGCVHGDDESESQAILDTRIRMYALLFAAVKGDFPQLDAVVKSIPCGVCMERVLRMLVSFAGGSCVSMMGGDKAEAVRRLEVLMNEHQ